VLHDPIVNELRRIRKAIAVECDGDPQKLYELYLRFQAESGARVVSLKPKPAKKLRRAR
jgi:hypothetical protein